MDSLADERWTSLQAWSYLATQNPTPIPTGHGTGHPTTPVRPFAPGQDSVPMLGGPLHS